MTIGRDRYVIAFTMESPDTHVPVDAQRLLRFASDLDGYWRTGRVRVPIKTAMKKEQVRERERYMRKRGSRHRSLEKSVSVAPLTIYSGQAFFNCACRAVGR